MRVVIIGATGATGRDLLEQVLALEGVERVQIFVRRATGRVHPKLEEYVIDFERMEEARDKIEGDVLFSCLGTTLAQAGGQEAQYRVDYTYQYEFARLAHSAGVATLVLVSSQSADSKSRAFYTRMKGELDDAVQGIGFERLFIFRPPLLVREGMRMGERVGIAVLGGLNTLGLLRSYRPMPTARLAEAMIKQALSADRGTHVLERADIWRLVEQ